MQSPGFTLEPPYIVIDGTEVSAVLQSDSATNIWEVIVVLAHRPTGQLINGSEVDAQLVQGDSSTPLKQLTRPSEPLVEAGGSLWVSANARFRFQGNNGTPTRLIINYRGQTATFAIQA